MLRLVVLVSVLSVGLCLPGGYSVVEPENEQEYRTIFEEVKSGGLLTLQENEIVRITKIEVQVVAGRNIRYTLLMKDGRTCVVVVFDQPWTHTREVHEQHCTAKRQLFGGYNEQTDDQEIARYKTILGEMVAKENLALGQYSVVKIETQVVAGLNIRYTLLVNGMTCTIVVFDQAWTKTRTITHNDCQTTGKRQLLGGYTNIDVHDPMIQQCLSMSLDRVNSMSNNMFRVVESNIMTARKQLVNGINYEVSFQTQQSSCMNNDHSAGLMAKDCPVDANSVLTPVTYKAHCYKTFSGPLTFVDAQQNKESDASNPDIQLDNDLQLGLKPIKKVGISLAQTKHDMNGKVKDMVTRGKGRLMASDQPVVSILRKKRDINFLIEKLDQQVGNSNAIDEIVEKGKALIGGGDDIDIVNHLKDLIGKDGHDFVKHGPKILGGDDHDMVPHGSKILGGDDHDMEPHGPNILGGDDHDIVPHGSKILGGDDHDMVPLGSKILGGDDHDMVPHGPKILGGDDHDMVPHGSKILGGDDHDMVPHGTKILGGDDHDMVPHGSKIIGGDDHDMVPHGTKKLGGDDHDMVPHGSKILGGDDHDMVPHGSKILGGDDHDLKVHGNQNKTKILGADGHDYCHIGMFLEFKAKFNKLYGSAQEEEKRYYTFCDNMRTARKLQETEKGTAIYGATKFADLTKEEFKQYVGKKWDVTASFGMNKAAIPRGKAPDAFDWRDHGAVTPVKNQGSCGSCWAFSTTGNIEGQWAIKKKKLISLSEQELVDCDKVDEGCNGGLPSQAYKEIERLGGLETETDYSYKGEDEKCEFNKTDVKVYINDSVSISSDETEMASWLAANGPISIGINAFAMQFYMGGISHPWKIFCNPKDLDHGVLIVGYGVQDDKPYWIVKNSWGPDWGEKGYYLVYRGAGVCGLNTMCTSAVVD